MDPSKIKILLVNDKAELRNIVRNYLRNDGFLEISVSENGRSAYKKAQEDRPDLIVADYELPGFNGLELLKTIRRDPGLADTPVILLAPESEQRLVAQAAEIGVSAYIVKPFSHKVLSQKVTQLLRRKIAPTAGDLTYQEANRLMKAGNYEAAMEKYREAMAETQEAMAVIHYKVGRVHEKLDQDALAESDYHEALAMTRVFVDAYDALGEMSLRQNRPTEALGFFEEGVKISPLNAERQFHLGETLMEAGQFQQAEKAFRTALDLDPSQTHIFNRLGVSLRRQGKTDEALNYLLRAADVAADDENLYYNISRVYHDKGDRDSALDYLERALALNPDFSEARALLAEIQS